KQFGAIGNGVEDDSASINNALLSIALSGGGVLRLTRGNYYINSPLLVGPGVRIVGDGSTDALNNISPRLGTQITSGPIDTAMRMLPAPMIDGWPDSEGGLSQGYSLKGVSFVSLDDHPGTAIELGPGGTGIETHLRNIYIEDINTRNYLTGVEFLGAYEVTIKRFSIRGAGRPAGSSAFKFTAPVTSGSISDGAVYLLDSGIYINTILVGFEIANIDFDNCNYCARTSGHVNGSVLRNFASEGTRLSDFVLNHTGRLVIDGFHNAGGATVNERIRSVGAGDTYLTNV